MDRKGLFSSCHTSPNLCFSLEMVCLLPTQTNDLLFYSSKTAVINQNIGAFCCLVHGISLIIPPSASTRLSHF